MVLGVDYHLLEYGVQDYRVVPEGGHCAVHQAITLDEVHGYLREGAGVIHTLKNTLNKNCLTLDSMHAGEHKIERIEKWKTPNQSNKIYARA